MPTAGCGVLGAEQRKPFSEAGTMWGICSDLLPAVPTAGAKAGPTEEPRKEGRESWEPGLGKKAESWVWEVECDLEGNPN